MNKLLASSAGLVAGSLLIAFSAHAAGPVTAANGMTLYTFDADSGGKPTCYDQCATNWPPYLGKTGDKMAAGWTLVSRTDGTMQWAYDGKPVYFYKGDKKKGQMAGDGMAGKWHTAMD